MTFWSCVKSLITNVLSLLLFPLRESHRFSTEIGVKLYEKRSDHRRETCWYL